MNINGFNNLIKKLNEIKNSDKEIHTVLVEQCLEIEAAAKRDCPVDTGNLRASIKTEVEGLSGVVGTNVEYAASVEYGTFKSHAQPFLYPALAAQKEEILNKIKEVILNG